MARKLFLEDRCKRCYMRLEVCLCAAIPTLELKTRLVLLMHCRELSATTNTGRLLSLALPNTEIRVRGEKDKPMNEEGIWREGEQPLLLYPSQDAHELNVAFLTHFQRPFCLIVPDGTWRQAQKIGRRIKALEEVPRVKLAPGAPSKYLLRRAPQRHCLSTIEAVARALGILEGEKVQKDLEWLFRQMVERTLNTRSPDSVRTRLPDRYYFW